MTIRCAQGTVSISSALTVGQTIDVNTDGAGNALTGFHTAATRAIIFKWIGSSTTGSAASNIRAGTGIAVSSSNRRAYGYGTHNGVTPTRERTRWRNDVCMVMLDTAAGQQGNVLGLVDYNGQVTDGFQLIIDDQLATTELVTWFAVWGDELSAAIVDFTSPSATGNQDYVSGFAMNTGLDDKGLFIIGGPGAAVDTISTDSTHMIGLAAGDTPENAVLLRVGDDAVATSVTWNYCRTGECIANSTAADAIAERAGVTQWNADGWRKNWTEVNGTAGLFRYSALALKGPRLKIFDLLSRTDTTQTDEVVGYDPLGVILISHSNSQSSSDTTQAGAIESVGFATGSSSRSVIGSGSQDNAGVAVNRRLLRTDAVYASIPTTVGVEDALMDIVDMSAPGGGFTHVMDDVEPSESFIAGLAVGSEFTSAVGSALHETMHMVCGPIES